MEHLLDADAKVGCRNILRYLVPELAGKPRDR
jgi:hypothetical protein